MGLICACGDALSLHPQDGPCIARSGLPNECKCTGFTAEVEDRMPPETEASLLAKVVQTARLYRDDCK